MSDQPMDPLGQELPSDLPNFDQEFLEMPGDLTFQPMDQSMDPLGLAEGELLDLSDMLGQGAGTTGTMDEMTGPSESAPPTEWTPAELQQDEIPPYTSPSLWHLPEKARPNPSTICEVCPLSMWFVTKEDGAETPTCYCQAMHTTIWTPKQQTVIPICDGQFRAEEQRKAAYLKELQGKK